MLTILTRAVCVGGGGGCDGGFIPDIIPSRPHLLRACVPSRLFACLPARVRALLRASCVRACVLPVNTARTEAAAGCWWLTADWLLHGGWRPAGWLAGWLAAAANDGGDKR